MIKYITSRPLWFNILVAIGSVFIILVIFILLLGLITRHGKSRTVPYVVGKNINDVEKQLSDAGFATVIQDSVYYDSLPRGVVIKQVPDADEVVKVNRTVYVIINRFVAPDIAMPNIIGYSLRNAQYTLESMGLKLGDTTSRVDFAKNTVLEISINGDQVKPGDKVKVGSKVDLVIARGKGEEDISVPKLIGLQVADARVLLEQYGLNLGSIVKNPDVMDIDNSYIFKQEPMPGGGRIRAGQLIDVWVQTEKPVTDSTQSQTPQSPQQ
ncbi:MAG: PASTA domain-containing protein [Flavisolibacter sp.]